MKLALTIAFIALQVASFFISLKHYVHGEEAKPGGRFGELCVYIVLTALAVAGMAYLGFYNAVTW